MNSLCLFMFCVAFWSLRVEADSFEKGCQFIRDNPDLMDDVLKCETDNYPERYNTITNICIKEATGLDNKKDFVRAVCQNRDFLLEATIKMQSCLQTHEEEILDMLPQLADGVPKAKACMKNLVEQREGSGRARRAVGEFSQGADTAANIKDGCQFILEPPFSSVNIWECETNNYPKKYNWFVERCIQEATGYDQNYFRAQNCHNENFIEASLIRMESCIRTHVGEMLDQQPELADAMPTARECLKNVVAKTHLSDNGLRVPTLPRELNPYPRSYGK